jgi:hypothetical protein
MSSVALAHDGSQNKEAIRMLERSVGLEATESAATTKRNTAAGQGRCRAGFQLCGVPLH